MAWCLLLTGPPNSGKSTIAYNLVQAKIRNALIIDGDRHREMQFLGKKLGFTREDIMANTVHVIKMAQFAQEQNMNVIIAQITPYKEQRDMMRNNIDNFYDVLCDCSHRGRGERENFKDSELVYERIGHDMVVDTEHLSVAKCCENILDFLSFEGVNNADSTNHRS